MLVGKFCCSGCSEILHCQELRICCWCGDVLCSLCQFSKCDSTTGRSVFHKTKKLESLYRKVSLPTRDQDEFVKQLEMCVTGVTAALEQNEQKAKRTRLEIRSTMKHMIVKFARIIKSQEKKLQHKLRRISSERSLQLRSILHNVSAIDRLIRHSYCKNRPSTQGMSYGSHDRMELKRIERLDIMKLMVSFKSTVDARMKFTPLSYIDMKHVLRTLPKMGVLQVQPDENVAESKEMAERPRYVASFRPVTSYLIENGVEERKSSDEEDSIGETDRDFGEYHIGKSLVKITPHQRVVATYQQGYRIVDDDVAIEDEIPVVPPKGSKPATKPKLLQRIPNAFRSNFLSQNKATSIKSILDCTGTNDSHSHTESSSATVKGVKTMGDQNPENTDDIAETATSTTKRGMRRFFKRNSHKIEPNPSSIQSVEHYKDTDRFDDHIIKVLPASNSSPTGKKSSSRDSCTNEKDLTSRKLKTAELTFLQKNSEFQANAIVTPVTRYNNLVYPGLPRVTELDKTSEHRRSRAVDLSASTIFPLKSTTL